MSGVAWPRKARHGRRDMPIAPRAQLTEVRLPVRECESV